MLHFILLQGESAPTSGPGYSSLIMIAVMVVIFYFFFIKPQQRKQKNQRKFTESVKKGESVVTIGGIHGKIASVEERTVILEVEKGVKIKVEKASISMEASQRAAG